jgi:hypothetical protein
MTVELSDPVEITRTIAALEQCIADCDAGYSRYDLSYYDSIITKLDALLPMTERISKARRLAQAGSDGGFSSSRFAYPHIRDQLISEMRDLQERLNVS